MVVEKYARIEGNTRFVGPLRQPLRDKQRIGIVPVQPVRCFNHHTTLSAKSADHSSRRSHLCVHPINIDGCLARTVDQILRPNIMIVSPVAKPQINQHTAPC